jgi:hypothetical protein
MDATDLILINWYENCCGIPLGIGVGLFSAVQGALVLWLCVNQLPNGDLNRSRQIGMYASHFAIIIGMCLFAIIYDIRSISNYLRVISTSGQAFITMFVIFQIAYNKEIRSTLTALFFRRHNLVDISWIFASCKTSQPHAMSSNRMFQPKATNRSA